MEKIQKIFSGDYTATGKTIVEIREEARIKLAKILIYAICLLISLVIIVGAILLNNLPEDKFTFENLLSLVLAVSSVFSGLLGSAITFYFSSKN